MTDEKRDRLEPTTEAGAIHEATDNAGLSCDGDHAKGWGTCQQIAARLPETEPFRSLVAENKVLRDIKDAATDVTYMCDCPPDWSMTDGSHSRECVQSEPSLRALRAALHHKDGASLPPDPALRSLGDQP